MVRTFEDDPAGPSVFVLSLTAGGMGLNLTRAAHVFHFDRWWNPAVEDEATESLAELVAPACAAASALARRIAEPEGADEDD